MFMEYPKWCWLVFISILGTLDGVVAEHLFDLKLERLDLVKIGKQTENNFIESTLVSWISLLSVWGQTNVLFT